MKNKGLPEPLLWGSLEVGCFVFLFLSPFLGSVAVQEGWSGVVLARIAAIAAWQYLLAPPGRVPVKERLQGVGRAALYSAPFWVSAILFPLRTGQQEVVSQSVLLFLGLLLISVGLGSLSISWLPPLLALLTLLTLHPVLTLDLAIPATLALASLLWARDASEGRNWPTGSLRWVILLGSIGWSFSLYLSKSSPWIDLGELGTVLLVWALMGGMGVYLLGVAREEHGSRPVTREIELVLPGLESALRWGYRRRLLRSWTPWLFALPGFCWSQEVRLVAVAALLGLPSLWILASKGRVTESNLLWWCSLQFVVLWGLVETNGEKRFGWLFLSLAIWLCAKLIPERGHANSDPQSQDLSRLPNLLRESRVKAPSHLIGEIMAHRVEPSVDLDQGLTAEAPTGFRQRLLAKLKESEQQD